MSAEGTAREAPGRLAESTRVEAFSDGVFAIALTLLVLDLHAPTNERGHFARTLLDQWQSYAAFLSAFLNISAIWLNHHDLFTRVRRVDIRLMGVNLILLLVATLFPFPAAVISSAMRNGDYSDQVSGSVLYAGIGILVPIAWILLYGYLARTRRLLTDDADVQYMRLGQRRSMVSIIVYPIAGVLAFIAPIISLIAFVALPLFFIGTLLYPPSDFG